MSWREPCTSGLALALVWTRYERLVRELGVVDVRAADFDRWDFERRLAAISSAERELDRVESLQRGDFAHAELEFVLLCLIEVLRPRVRTSTLRVALCAAETALSADVAESLGRWNEWPGFEKPRKGNR